jgi:hypothetical protein
MNHHLFQEIERNMSCSETSCDESSISCSETSGDNLPITTTKSGRISKRRDFFHQEIIVGEGFIEFHTVDHCGLDQPGSFTMTNAEIQEKRLRDKGHKLYKRYMEPAKWKWRASSGLESEWIFVAPNTKDLEEGRTKFTGYISIAETYYQNRSVFRKRMERIMAKAAASAAASEISASKDNINQQQRQTHGSNASTVSSSAHGNKVPVRLQSCLSPTKKQMVGDDLNDAKPAAIPITSALVARGAPEENTRASRLTNNKPEASRPVFEPPAAAALSNNKRQRVGDDLNYAKPAARLPSIAATPELESEPSFDSCIDRGSRRASRDSCLPPVIVSSSRLPGSLATPRKLIASVEGRTEFTGYISIAPKYSVFRTRMERIMAKAAASTAASEISASKDNINQQQRQTHGSNATAVPSSAHGNKVPVRLQSCLSPTKKQRVGDDLNDAKPAAIPITSALVARGALEENTRASRLTNNKPVASRLVFEPPAVAATNNNKRHRVGDDLNYAKAAARPPSIAAAPELESEPSFDSCIDRGSRRASRDSCLPPVIVSSSRLPGSLATTRKSILDRILSLEECFVGTKNGDVGTTAIERVKALEQTVFGEYSTNNLSLVGKIKALEGTIQQLEEIEKELCGSERSGLGDKRVERLEQEILGQIMRDESLMNRMESLERILGMHDI